MSARSGGRTLQSAVLATLLVGLLALGACGAPEYTYVTNSDDHTYLKVPTSWQEIAPADLESSLGLDPGALKGDGGVWLQAYDAAVPPSPSHLFGQTADAPAVLVAVQDVPDQTRGQVSLDALRDYFFPVSATARSTESANPSSQLSSFALLDDQTLTPGDGVRGVHSVFRYKIAGGPSQIFDQTMYVNDDASKVYLFFVRCSVQCYDQRSKEIGLVVSSFTVRQQL